MRNGEGEAEVAEASPPSLAKPRESEDWSWLDVGKPEEPATTEAEEPSEAEARLVGLAKTYLYLRENLELVYSGFVEFGLDVDAEMFDTVIERLAHPETGSAFASQFMSQFAGTDDENEEAQVRLMEVVRDAVMDLHPKAVTAREIAAEIGIAEHKVQRVSSCLSTLRGLGWVKRTGDRQWAWTGQTEGPMSNTHRIDEVSYASMLNELLESSGSYFTAKQMASAINREVTSLSSTLRGLRVRGLIRREGEGWIINEALVKSLIGHEPGGAQPGDPKTEGEPVDPKTEGEARGAKLLNMVRAVEGRRAVAEGKRPPIKDAIAQVMGEETLNADEIHARLETKGWLPNSKNTRAFVGYLLSATKEKFERVPTKGRGFYKVAGVK